jgi:osmotically-inducible protein OsmY
MKPVVLFTIAAFFFPFRSFAQAADPVETAVEKSLSSAPYQNVHAYFRGPVVTLTGTVNLYATRVAAQDKVGRIRGINAIENKIRVVTPAIPDDKLRANVEESMAGRLHRHKIPKSLFIDVHDGVVSVDGYVRSPQLADDIFEAVEQTTGVREVVNRIQLPASNLPNPTGGYSPWPSVPPDIGTGVTSQ